MTRKWRWNSGSSREAGCGDLHVVAEGLEQLARDPYRPRALGIGPETVLGGAVEQADPEPAGIGTHLLCERPGGRRRNEGVTRPVTGDLVEHGGRVANRPGENMIDGKAVPGVAASRALAHAAPTRLEAEERAAACRDADRAPAVIAVRDRNHPGRDRSRRAPRGTSARVLCAPGVTGRPECAWLCGDRGAELRGVRATEHDKARPLEPLHEKAVPSSEVTSRLSEGGPFAIGLTRLRGTEILQQDRHAPERPASQL